MTKCICGMPDSPNGPPPRDPLCPIHKTADRFYRESQELVSVTMGSHTARRLAMACNRARNMLMDLIETEDLWMPNEREQEMLDLLGWASRWLVGEGAQIEGHKS